MDFNIFKVPKDKNWGIQFRKSVEVLAGVAQFSLLLFFALILIVFGGIAYALKAEDPTPWIRGTCMIQTIYDRPCKLEGANVPRKSVPKSEGGEANASDGANIRMRHSSSSEN